MSGFGKITIFNGLLGNRPNFFCWASDYLIWSSYQSHLATGRPSISSTAVSLQVLTTVSLQALTTVSLQALTTVSLQVLTTISLQVSQTLTTVSLQVLTTVSLQVLTTVSLQALTTVSLQVSLKSIIGLREVVWGIPTLSYNHDKQQTLNNKSTDDSTGNL